MNNQIRFLSGKIIRFLAILAILFVTLTPGEAIAFMPPDPGGRSIDFVGQHDLNQDEQGRWYTIDDPTEAFRNADRPESPAASGGPDEYGYTWSDEVAFTWIDVSDGTDTGLAGYEEGAGPVDLPFPFPFYGGTYSQLWISINGFLAFSDEYLWIPQSEIPSPGEPNNLIAPYWTPIYLEVDSWVRYKNGGVSPNRYFAVEWHNARGGDPGDPDYYADRYTFEAILYENGNILFSYLTTIFELGGRWCGSAGIEDPSGLDGLPTMGSCGYPYPGKSVLITHPAPAARVRLSPQFQGKFTNRENIENYPIEIFNNGDLGADVYDISVTSGWPTALFAADGITPLTDTDGDSLPDTGPVASATGTYIALQVTTPAGAVMDAYNQASILVRSSLDPSRSKTAVVANAIPAPFAQVLQDSNDGVGKVLFAQPIGYVMSAVTQPEIYPSRPAVVETPDGDFWVAFTDGRCLDDLCDFYVNEIYISRLDRYGQIKQSAHRLIDLSGSWTSVSDDDLHIAATSDGGLALLWIRQYYQPDNKLWNGNVFFAKIGADGQFTYSPTNLTNNALWGDYYTDGFPQYHDTDLAVTSTGSLVLGWEQWLTVGSDDDIDIMLAARNHDGSPLTSPQAYDLANSGCFQNPTFTPLSLGKVLLVFSDCGTLAHGVVDSAANPIRTTAWIFDSKGFYYDSAVLSNSNILLAWTDYENNDLHYMLMGGADFLPVSSPVVLYNPASRTGNKYVSVAPIASGGAVLTWMDAGDVRLNLYYARVGGDGHVITPPLPYYTAEGDNPYVSTSYGGQGNTTYSWTPPDGVDLSMVTGGLLVGGTPGGAAALPVSYASLGGQFPEQVIITATLGISPTQRVNAPGALGELVYLGDTSGVTPTIVGNQVVWNLPEMDFLEQESFMLYLSVPDDTPIGDQYAVSLAISSETTDVTPGDNSVSMVVMAAHQLFLPLVTSD